MKNTEAIKSQCDQLRQTGTGVLVPYAVDRPKKIICDVCGHANTEDSALCKMCSNYLQRS